ncbi:MAG: xanthine dehydrogenase family protein subunit M [Geothrix sp.]|nr:xanthine dehydrogenase family protein subunit M [Geothrix sp.]
MRGQPALCEVLTPTGLNEALSLRAAHPGARPLAGGTDLMVPFAAGRLPDRLFLNLWGLEELRGIHVTEAAATLGALTLFREIAAHPLLQREFPNLVRSAKVTGALAIQSRGSLGGNIANGSPAADSPPSLLAYGAELELTSLRGSRWVPYAGFHTGYKQSLLAPDELITRIRLVRPGDGGFHYFRKVGTRQAQAIAKVSLAAWVRVADGRIRELRLALGSVAPMPIRAQGTEGVLMGRPLTELPLEAALQALQADISPIDDLRSSAKFRRRVAGNLLADMLRGLASA